MQKIILVILSVFVGFIAENFLAEFSLAWLRPNLLIILIVFFNLSRGIRYGLLAALMAGLLKDSFSSCAFGMNIFSYVSCAFLATFLKVYVYAAGSNVSRMMMVFMISLANVLLHYLLSMMIAPVVFSEMFVHVLVPEVLVTTVLTEFVFRKMKQCALKFSV